MCQPAAEAPSGARSVQPCHGRRILAHRRQVVEWCDLCEESTAAVMHSSRRSLHPRRTAALGSNQLESRLRSGMAERVSVQPARRRQPQRLRRRDQRAWRAGRTGRWVGRAADIGQRRRTPSCTSVAAPAHAVLRDEQSARGASRRTICFETNKKQKQRKVMQKDSLLSFNRRC